MKKFFSLFAALLFAGSMMAAEYTFTALETPAEATADGLTFTFSKNSGSTNPAWNAGSSEARLYAKGSLTISSSSKKITKVVYNYVVNKNKSGKAPTIDGVAGATNAGTWTETTKTWEDATGDTEITLSTSGEAGNLGFKSITVTFAAPAEEIDATGIALDQTLLTLAEGRTATLKATLTPANATTAVTWESSDEKVATVSSGKVTAVAAGTATITAKAGDYSATCAVTVTEAPDPTNCAEAAEAALSVSGDNVEYKNGKVYTIEGYVTAIQTAYSSQYNNITFWMADTEDGGKVLEAFRAACASEADAPAVGNKVKVTGKLTKYGTTPEFAAGCTYEIVTEPVDPDQPSVTATPEEFEITAEGSEDKTVTLEYANLGETFVVEATADAEATWITNIALSADKSKLTFDVAANDGAARTATITVTATAGEIVKTATITVSQAKYVAPLTGDYFAKVTATADITDGAYLIVYEGDDSHDAVAFDGSLETLDAVNNGLAVTIAENKIAATEALLAAVFTLDKTAGTLKSASGLYIGKTAYSNGLDAKADTEYTNTFAIDEDGNAVITASGNCTLRYNYAKDQLRFRYFKSGQQAVALYKLVKEQGPATALTNTAVETKAVKTLRNGILVIEKAGVRYNVMGQIIR